MDRTLRICALALIALVLTGAPALADDGPWCDECAGGPPWGGPGAPNPGGGIGGGGDPAPPPISGGLRDLGNDAGGQIWGDAPDPLGAYIPDGGWRGSFWDDD